MKSDREARDALQAFLAAQARLLEALRSVHGGDGRLSAALGQIPRRGAVEVEDGEWRFHRHGAGVMFEHVGSHVRVDVPSDLDEPWFFDAWRLGTYFGSMGRRGTKALEMAIGVRGLDVDESVRSWMERLVAAGIVVRSGRGYRMSS